MKRASLLGAGLLAVTVAVFGVGPASAANPPITDATRTLIQRVADACINGVQVTISTTGTCPSGSVRAGGMSGLEIVGEDAYVLKSTSTGLAALYHIDNFNTANVNMAARVVKPVGGSAPTDLGHPNGLAYYRTPSVDPMVVGSFYIPMIKSAGQKQVAQVNSKGEITAQFGARLEGTSGSTGTRKVASVTYYKNGTFIVGTSETRTLDPNDSSVIWRPYYTAKIVGSDFQLMKKFYVPTTLTYSVGQDIYYDSGNDELLVPLWDGESEDLPPTGRNNRIVVVELGTVSAGRVYAPKRWIRVNVAASNAAKFELEGITRDDDGKLFVASNIIHPDGVTHIDGIHKLTGS